MHCYICKNDINEGETDIIIHNGKLTHIECLDSESDNDLEETIRNKLPEAYKLSTFEIYDTLVSTLPANPYYLIEDETDDYIDIFETIHDAIQYLKQHVSAESEYIIYDSNNHVVIYLDIEYVIRMRNESEKK